MNYEELFNISKLNKNWDPKSEIAPIKLPAIKLAKKIEIKKHPITLFGEIKKHMEFSLGSDYSSIEPLLNQAQEILIKHYPYEPKNQESDISPKKDFPNELFSQLIYDIEELLEAMLIVKRIQ